MLAQHRASRLIKILDRQWLFLYEKYKLSLHYRESDLGASSQAAFSKRAHHERLFMSTQDIYMPPFTITTDILNLAVNIGEGAGKLLPHLESPATAKARRADLLRTVYATLALEGGPFSENDISQILEGGKGGFAPREVQKVRNTLEAYEHLSRLTPHVETDLLAAHRTLMTGLANRPGQYRQDGDIAMAAGRPLYMAPPAARLPTLMRNLTYRLQHTRFHPIIAACVFHYELERIHPFPDGNGRLGRLWQTRILSAWNPAFMYVPVDYQLIDHQEDYFQALQYASELADAAPFVNFMLHMLTAALRGQTQNQITAKGVPGQLSSAANVAAKAQPNDGAGPGDAAPVAESAPAADAAAVTAAPAPATKTDPASPAARAKVARESRAQAQHSSRSRSRIPTPEVTKSRSVPNSRAYSRWRRNDSTLRRRKTGSGEARFTG